MFLWSLKELFEKTNNDIENRLSSLRRVIQHSVAKGNATEMVWFNLLQDYLPSRYSVTSGFVIDSKNEASLQIDILIFDRHYSPFIFKQGGFNIIPAESVYAGFEVKQKIASKELKDARDKIRSIRALHRTSKPIICGGKEIKAREEHHIIGGLLALDLSIAEGEDRRERFEKSLRGALNKSNELDRLDLGCAANYCYFDFDEKKKDTSNGDLAMEYKVHRVKKPVMHFLFRLISQLQSLGTVPAIDLDDYAKFLD